MRDAVGFAARFLREQNPRPRIVGVQPAEGASIPGIRRWTPEYQPSIFDGSLVDREMDIDQQTALNLARRHAGDHLDPPGSAPVEERSRKRQLIPTRRS